MKVLEQAEPGEVDETITALPSDHEIHERLEEIKATAGGDDEVTADLSRTPHGRARSAVYDLVSKTLMGP